MQVFIRDGVERDSRALAIEKMQLDEIRKDLNEEFRIVEGATFERLRSALVGATARAVPASRKVLSSLTRSSTGWSMGSGSSCAWPKMR